MIRATAFSFILLASSLKTSRNLMAAIWKYVLQYYNHLAQGDYSEIWHMYFSKNQSMHIAIITMCNYTKRIYFHSPTKKTAPMGGRGDGGGGHKKNNSPLSFPFPYFYCLLSLQIQVSLCFLCRQNISLIKFKFKQCPTVWAACVSL